MAERSSGDSSRQIRVEVTAPSPGWRLNIRAVYTLADEIVVVSELEPPDPDFFYAQVLTAVTDELELTLPQRPIRHLVFGRTWTRLESANAGSAHQRYEFPNDRQELSRLRREAKRRY